MNKENILYGVIGLLAGIVIAGFVAGQSVNNNYTGMMRMMGMDTSRIRQDASDHSMMSMADMSQQLAGLSGDEFDRNFIEMMIAHHDGAINMAELAETRAQHQEIKDLSKNIISAQAKEITEMQQWQKDWGYTSSSYNSMPMMH